MVDKHLAHFEWWPNTPQWEWAEEVAFHGPIVVFMWIRVNLYLNCIYSRFFPPSEECLSQQSLHICDIINGHVDDMQKSHINNLKTPEARRDVMKRVPGVSGKARLPIRIQRFYSYTKSANQTIDQAVSDLRKLRNDIADVNASSAPSDIAMATTLMSACKESEFDIIKVILGMSDHLTTELAVEKLRTVETTKHSANFAGRGPRKRDLSQVKCYICDEKGHLMRGCPMRGLARKKRDAQQSSHK